MPGVAITGELSYNGYSFDGSSKLKVSSTPISDDAGRTVVCVETVITVFGIVAAETGTDRSLEQIRAALTKQGQRLIFKNKGFGRDLDINSPAGDSWRDVRWGPKPEMLSWSPIGDSQAAQIEWQIKTWLPPICNTNGLNNQSGIMALNYSVDFKINSKGFTTRTITGYIEIAQTRLGRTVPDSADAYRDKMQPPIPLGFERMQSWSISANKSRVDFAITDKEIEASKPWPDGVVKIDGQHVAQWSRSGKAAGHYKNRFTMDIEMKRGISRALSLKIFLDAAFSRIEQHRQDNRGVLVDSFEMNEDLFGRGSSFGITWRLLKGLKDLGPDQLGLWTAFENSAHGNFHRWRSSVADVFGNRGLAGLGISPSADVIIDLCDPRGLAWYDDSRSPITDPPRPPGVPPYRNVKPPLKESYLDYKQSLMSYRKDPVSRQSYMQSPPYSSGDSPDLHRNEPLKYPPPTGMPDVVQSGGNPRYGVVLVGAATRVGYPIPRPALTSVGGATPVEENCAFVQAPVQNCMGVPVYSATWEVDYLLTKSPGIIGPMRDLTDAELFPLE